MAKGRRLFKLKEKILTSEMLSAEKYLRVVQSRGERSVALTRVYRNMRQRGLFLKAYAKIYANSGATTVGTDPEDTIQGMSMKRIDTILEQLKDGTYQWKPSRRIYVPKSDGSKRPLSIPNWSDKLVQEVMRMILEAYYEPQFRESSHGFRPHRGCHTALIHIKRSWSGTRWFIEGDIKGCFDNINHDLVIHILSQKIHDNRFIKLVKGMLKAGYMDSWQYHKTHSGTPQGGIISPLISNIVLNLLDKYVEDVLVHKYTRGKKRKSSLEYARIQAAKGRAKKQGKISLYQELDKQLRQIPSVEPYDPEYRRLRYCRYADDFILGFIGTKEEAEAIKVEVGAYLNQMGLTLSEKKTLITHARTEKARFLGYEIKVAWDNTQMTKMKSGGKRRSMNGVVQLYVPRDIRTKWTKKYTRNNKVKATGVYIELSDYAIVQAYGDQLRGLVNYYALAKNLNASLGYVRWVCMESARKTLAAKHKIRTKRKSYEQYYHDGVKPYEWRHIQVKVKREGKSSLTAKCGETPLRTQKVSYLNDTITSMQVTNKTSELITRLLKEECELCGKKSKLEAHHVNKLKDLKKRWEGRSSKPEWVQRMIARRRKTLFLCHECHMDITHGRYDGKRVN